MTTHLVLVMIVRDEAERIDRCITSALPIIDAMIISDTGSTDTTIDKLSKYIKPKIVDNTSTDKLNTSTDKLDNKSSDKLDSKSTDKLNTSTNLNNKPTDKLDNKLTDKLDTSTNLNNKLTDNLDSKSIIGHIYHDKWINYGPNRNLVLKHACHWIETNTDWDLLLTYALLLDADFILEIHDFDRSKLTYDSYYVYQFVYKSNGHVYGTHPNLRLIRLNLDWNAVGNTHEVWMSTMATSSILDSLIIRDINDGTNHTTKLQRDLVTLKADIEANPNESRFVFYLANTYYSLRDYNLAITWYQKRLSMKGWVEDEWYATYRLAECYRKLGESLTDHKYDLLAISHYSICNYLKPHRREPILRLAQYAVKQGNHLLGVRLTLTAKQIPYITEAHVIENIEHKLNWIFITSAYCSRLQCPQSSDILRYYELAMQLNDYILFNPCSSPIDQRSANYNTRWYCQRLIHSRIIKMSFDSYGFRPPYSANSVTLNPMNWTLIRYKHGYLAIVRNTNYQINKVPRLSIQSLLRISIRC